MSYNMNKLTEKAQEAIAAGQRHAEERRNTQLEPEHILQALVAQDGGVVPSVLEKLDVDPRTVGTEVEAAIGGFAQSTTPSQLSISPRFRQMFESATSEAERLKDDYIST